MTVRLFSLQQDMIRILARCARLLHLTQEESEVNPCINYNNK